MSVAIEQKYCPHWPAVTQHPEHFQATHLIEALASINKGWAAWLRILIQGPCGFQYQQGPPYPHPFRLRSIFFFRRRRRIPIFHCLLSHLHCLHYGSDIVARPALPLARRIPRCWWRWKLSHTSQYCHSCDPVPSLVVFCCSATLLWILIRPIPRCLRGSLVPPLRHGMGFPFYANLNTCAQLETSTCRLCLITRRPHNKFGDVTLECFPYTYRRTPGGLSSATRQHVTRAW